MRDFMIKALAEMGFAVVRDRNLPKYQMEFDSTKIRYLLSTCDALCCFCYGKDEIGDSGKYRTSKRSLDELEYALEMGMQTIVVYKEDVVADDRLDAIIDMNRKRIQLYGLSLSDKASLDAVKFTLYKPWEAVWPEDHSVFVTVPFEEDYERVFQVIREEVWCTCRLQCRRSSEYPREKTDGEVPVHQRIPDLIRRAPFVIQVLPLDRPNCWIEVGIALAFNKAAIRLTRKDQKIPFMIKHLPVVKFDPGGSLEDLRRGLERELAIFAREEKSLNDFAQTVIG